MEKEFLKKLIEDGKSERQIANLAGKSQTTICYWLKKYKLKTHLSLFGKEYGCKCGETNPEKFYGHKKQICSKCHNEYTKKLGQEKRKRAIDLLGGKCKICDYNKYYGSIDIHHLDPSHKDEKFKELRGWSWKRIDREIKNCVALCRNCHGEVHGGIIKIGV